MSLPNIVITLKNSIYSRKNTKTFSITLTPSDYITKQRMNIDIVNDKEFIDIDECDLDFISYNTIDDRNEILFGLKFMRKYYTTFDYERKIIGLNEYKNVENTSNYAELLKHDNELDLLIENWTKIFG
jgi:hypothetical protein